VLLPEFASVATYAVMAVVLLWRPQGLFGRA
jgi:branched-subunit amino acid ABC-type transport system permease component